MNNQFIVQSVYNEYRKKRKGCRHHEVVKKYPKCVPDTDVNTALN